MSGTRILFFGPLKDVMGTSEIRADISTDINNDFALVDWLSDGDPAKKQALMAGTVRLCIDQNMSPRGTCLAKATEIAFLPPFSGG